MPRARLLFNPNAGRFPPEKAAAIAAGRLRRRGWSVEILATHSAAHVTSLARAAAEEQLEAVIIAGGDGSVGRAAAGLQATQTSLAVLPTGTANVWARELGLPAITPRSARHIEAIADLIAASRRRWMDIGFCNGAPFLLWAGIGLDALVVRQSEKKRSRLKKFFAYPEYALRAFGYAAKWPGIQISLEARGLQDGSSTRLEGRFQLAVISNIRLYAGGFAQLSPEARINDGQMDLWLFEGRGFPAALRNAWQILRGSHLEAETCRAVPFSELCAHLSAPTFLHADGDPLPDSGQVKIEVRPKTLSVLIPQTAPASLLQ